MFRLGFLMIISPFGCFVKMDTASWHSTRNVSSLSYLEFMKGNLSCVCGFCCRIWNISSLLVSIPPLRFSMFLNYIKKIGVLPFCDLIEKYVVKFPECCYLCCQLWFFHLLRQLIKEIGEAWFIVPYIFWVPIGLKRGSCASSSGGAVKNLDGLDSLPPSLNASIAWW